MAFGEDNVSVRQRVCCGTLLRGRFIRFILLSVAVNQGSTLELNTMLHVDLWAKAAAEAGNSIVGIMNTGCFRLIDKAKWNGKQCSRRGDGTERESERMRGGPNEGSSVRALGGRCATRSVMVNDGVEVVVGQCGRKEG
jgi:hypothetical protein